MTVTKRNHPRSIKCILPKPTLRRSSAVYINDVNLCEIKSIADLEKLFMLKEKTIFESEKKCEHSI
jgi:hypothetical protein